jgi:hypothetical protein
MYKAGKKKFFIVFLTLSCFFMQGSLLAQFAPGPQDLNSTAIYKNSNSFSFWATEIEIERGWQSIADTTIGKTSIGDNLSAIGKANNKIISLGDAGFAIIQFPFPIYNVAGNDFAIFENGFAQNESAENLYFMELAKVEVSEDGITYIPFESTSNIDNSIQKLSFETSNCTYVNNLAGKYPINYGTPFDLDELGLDSILFIKVIDVVGSIDTNFATYDSQMNIINDPYPTAFTSGGFDLNAIGALNQPNEEATTTDTINTSLVNNSFETIKVYPNPVKQNGLFFIETGIENSTVEIYSAIGERLLYTQFSNSISIETTQIEKGIYFLKINDHSVKKIMISN